MPHRILFPACLLFLSGFTGFAQEYNLHPNSLIYSNQAIIRLKQIADSLHTLHPNGAIDHNYRSVLQTRGHYLWIDTLAEEALAFVKTDPEFGFFIKKHPPSTTIDNLLLTKTPRKNEQNEDAFWYYSHPVQKDIVAPNKERHITTGVAGRWVYKFYDMSGYQQSSALMLFYLAQPFADRPMPPKYVKLLQYVDLLIDTTSLFRPNAQNNYYRNQYNFYGKTGNLPAADAFYAYIELSPEFPEKLKQRKLPYNDYAKYQQVRRDYADLVLSGKPEFIRLLQNAVYEAINKACSDPDLEYFAGKYLHKKHQLELLRSRYVSGECSEDQSPRNHALEIAQAAAEIGRWNIFIKAHLQILNDNFSRVSDGSYAQENRLTYVQELEAINVDVSTLLTGICLRANSGLSQPYRGDTRRVGRALAESQSFEAVAAQLRTQIADPELDDFNRLLSWYLYDNIMHHKAPQERNQEKRLKIHQQIDRQIEPVKQTLPGYLAKGQWPQY